MNDEWISVQAQERPALHAEQVWCYDENAGVTTGYFHGWRDGFGDWHDSWAIDGEYDLYAVTHWRPLPRPEAPQ